MIRLIAIDDEPLALRLLEVYAAKTPGVTLLAACTSPHEAEPWLQQADGLLIDINMPDINGMDFIRSRDDTPPVIFTTAYSEYAVEGFRVNAVDYLLKPFSLSEFQGAVGKLEERLAQRRQTAGSGGILLLETPHRTVRIETARIRYIEGMGEYLKIHLEGETAPLILLYRMKNMADALPCDEFLRIHKSYIIPLSRIREFRRNSVTLTDGLKLPVGEAYRDAFLERCAQRNS